MPIQERKNNTVSYIPLILFLCNVLVLTNTNINYFRQMDKLDYYTFHQYSIWCSIGLFIQTIILGWYGWLSIIQNRDGLELKIKRVYCCCFAGMLYLGLLPNKTLKWVESAAVSLIEPTE